MDKNVTPPSELGLLKNLSDFRLQRSQPFKSSLKKFSAKQALQEDSATRDDNKPQFAVTEKHLGSLSAKLHELSNWTELQAASAPFYSSSSHYFLFVSMESPSSVLGFLKEMSSHFSLLVGLAFTYYRIHCIT
ncbi:uncharacterized protein LOC132063204 [Lycium ferocissimum]|uniref:uncharacterized protein LOC132063204 n=1 Tax=Lycium ferocissimum TaxID=112874 RepID=UPI002815A208|nr:uncharacterized protein LOC132063204 [Lycium ferocissimum]